MNRSVRWGVWIATLVGIGIAVATVGAVGMRQVLSAVALIGWGGMAILIGCSGIVLTLLGFAWYAVAPARQGEGQGMPGLYIWARTVREAATDILPFSQFGGLVIGAQVLAARGTAQSLIYASMIVDMTTELGAQLLFTLFGLAALASATMVGASNGGDHAGIVPMVGAGVLAMVAICAMILLFVLARRPLLRIAAALAERLLPGSAAATMAASHRLDEIYAQPRRVMMAFVLNLAAWIVSAAGAWPAVSLMGADISLANILAIEALIFTVRSVAFAVPGAIGVQEVAYAMIGPIFGLPPAAAIALSLAKRARDLLIGVPALLFWQISEVRTLSGGSFPQARDARPKKG